MEGDVDSTRDTANSNGDGDNGTSQLVIKKKKRSTSPPISAPVPVPVPVPVPSLVSPPDFPSNRMEKVQQFFELLVARKKKKTATDIPGIVKRLEQQAFEIEKAVWEGRLKEELVRVRFFNPTAASREPSSRPVPPAAASRPYESAAAAISISTTSPPTSPSSLAASTEDIDSTFRLPPPAIVSVSVPPIVLAPAPVQSRLAPAPAHSDLAPVSATLPVPVPVCSEVPLSLSPDRLEILAEIKQLMIARVHVNISPDLLSQLEHHALCLEKAVFEGTMDMEKIRARLVRPPPATV